MNPIENPPNENASVEEWKKWGCQLQKIAKLAQESIKSQREKIRELKKDLKRKNKACVFYKSEIQQYKDLLSEYENKPIRKSLYEFGKIVRDLRRFKPKNKKKYAAQKGNQTPRK